MKFLLVSETIQVTADEKKNYTLTMEYFICMTV